MRLERLIHRRLCDRQQWKLLQKWNVDTQYFEAMTLSLDTIGEKITLYIVFPLVSPDFRSLMHSSPAWFSLLVALYLSGSGHQHELFRNERDLFVDSFHRFFRFFFLLPPLPSFLPRDIDRSRETERERKRERWNFEVVLSLHVSRSIIRRSRTARTVPDYIEITRYNAI